MNFDDLVRPNIRKMQAYASGKSEFSGEAQIFLDTNENPFGDNIVNRYPDPLQKKLTARLAAIKTGFFSTPVTPQQLALGNGSDEFIDMLIRIFCEPGIDRIVFCPPTFGMYAVAADLNAVATTEVPLDAGFDLDVDGILAENGKAKLLFLCNPNNPTGNRLSPDRLETVVRKWQGIVIVDEAYVDFCPEESLLPRLAAFPRLVILQTLSKAWGMAGVRLGLAIADPQIIALLHKVKMPYNIGVLKEKFVLKELTDTTRYEHERTQILAERSRLAAELEPLAEEIFPSAANFLLVRFADGKKTYRYLREHGVIVRDFSARPRLENCLRITVGTPDENTRLIALLSDAT